ncbi:hypothetical protein C8R44DRAFT_873542 [Mycena epipterygia]|nr:hypothetical protein C8R44DRAFT_873542 [Mycena epipterygia]
MPVCVSYHSRVPAIPAAPHVPPHRSSPQFAAPLMPAVPAARRLPLVASATCVAAALRRGARAWGRAVLAGIRDPLRVCLGLRNAAVHSDN